MHPDQVMSRTISIQQEAQYHIQSSGQGNSQYHSQGGYGENQHSEERKRRAVNVNYDDFLKDKDVHRMAPFMRKLMMRKKILYDELMMEQSPEEVASPEKEKRQEATVEKPQLMLSQEPPLDVQIKIEAASNPKIQSPNADKQPSSNKDNAEKSKMKELVKNTLKDIEDDDDDLDDIELMD